MERDQAAREIDAAIGWLKGEQGVAKVGCIGFCMGGGLTLATASGRARASTPCTSTTAAACPGAEQIATISVPVMGSYGAEDQGIPRRAGEQACARR